MSFVLGRDIYGYHHLKVGGPRVIGYKWIETNKCDSRRPNHRSRLVATELRWTRTPIFAGTPPLEALRILITMAAQADAAGDPDPIRLRIIDVSKAHFYTDAHR